MYRFGAQADPETDIICIDGHAACADHRLRRAAGCNARLGNALLQPLLHGHHLKIQDSKRKNTG